VVKPVQTGVGPDQPGDLAEVQRLTGLRDLHEYLRYAEPLAPATAARRQGEYGLDMWQASERVAALADRELVIIEGAGGALVRLNTEESTIYGLATHLGERYRVEVVLVASAGLGVLSTAALTANAFCHDGPGLHHVVIGDWPASPDLAARCNLGDLRDYAQAPLSGVIAHGVEQLDRRDFAELAVRSLTPALGGDFDAANFITQNAAPLPAQKGRS